MARAGGGDEIQDSRGVAIADFNGDGRLDLAINNNNGRPALYWNRLENGGRFLSLDLRGRQGNRDAVGAKARLTLARADGSTKTLTRWVEAGSGYASQGSHTLHFGLGDAERIENLEIHWPGGGVDRIDTTGVALDQRLTVVEGGKLVAANHHITTETRASPAREG